MAIYRDVSLAVIAAMPEATYLAKTFGFGVLLETESREVDTRTEHFCLCQDTDTTDTVNLHFHVWVAVWIAEVG